MLGKLNDAAADMEDAANVCKSVSKEPALIP